MSIDQGLPPGDVNDVAGLAPGPLLVEQLEAIDPSVLEGADAVVHLQAWARVRNRTAARFLTAVHEAGRAEDGTRTRRAIVDEFAGDEVALALGWSRAMAGRWLELADDLHRRLIEVQAAMASGELDESKARVFSEWTRDLDDDHAHHVCEVLLPEAPGSTVGELIERIQEVAGALDPEWASRRERAAEKRARVVASRNPSGTANVAGCDLPMDSAVTIMARVEALAWAVRRGGLARQIAWLRAKVYERLLDGFAAGLTDDVLVPLLIADLTELSDATDDDTRARPAVGDDSDEAGAEDEGHDDEGPGDEGPGDEGPDDEGPDDEGPEDRGAHDDGPDTGPGGPPDGAGEPEDDPADRDADLREPGGAPPVESPQAGRVRDGIVEVRLRLSTALGLDDLPAHVPGWGTTLAPTARTMLDRYRDGEWRIVVTDDEGRLRGVLLLRRRPRSPGPRPRDQGRGRGSRAIVELAAPASLLTALVPDDHPAWTAVLHEVQQRLADSAGASDGPPDHPADAARRLPRAEVDRWVRVRDRQCVAPGCRRPAHAGDLDHTVDHALGGPSLSWNCGVWCRHHHRTKHEGGWRVSQPTPGRFRITTRAGAHHLVEPPRVIEPLPEPRPAEAPRPLPDHEQDLPGDQADDETDEEPFLRAATTRSTAASARRAAIALVDPPPPF